MLYHFVLTVHALIMLKTCGSWRIVWESSAVSSLLWHPNVTCISILPIVSLYLSSPLFLFSLERRRTRILVEYHRALFPLILFYKRSATSETWEIPLSDSMNNPFILNQVDFKVTIHLVRTKIHRFLSWFNCSLMVHLFISFALPKLFTRIVYIYDILSFLWFKHSLVKFLEYLEQ